MSILNVKVPADLKREAQNIARDFGIPVSSIVNDALRRFVRERSITFSDELVPNIETAEVLRQARRDIDSGKDMSQVFTNTAEMDAHLDNL